MARYYAFAAGLPNIGIEDRKLPISINHFESEALEILTRSDAAQFKLLRLQNENKQIAAFVQECKEVASEEGTCPEADFTLVDSEALYRLVWAAKEHRKLPKEKEVPPYIKGYILLQFPKEDDEPEEVDEDTPRRSVSLLALEEDRIAALYYNYLIKKGKAFVAQWAELNLNVNNVLAAHTCAEWNWDLAHYIVGDNAVAQQLRESKGQHFGLSEEELPYLADLQAIAQETDITRRERMIDLLRWNWLEEQTFFLPFDAEFLYAYYLQLSIIERWISLDEVTGEKTFRQIVQVLKKESNESLQEFKRNQKK